MQKMADFQDGTDLFDEDFHRAWRNYLAKKKAAEAAANSQGQSSHVPAAPVPAAPDFPSLFSFNTTHTNECGAKMGAVFKAGDSTAPWEDSKQNPG